MLNLVKRLAYIKCYSSPEISKTLAIISEETVRTSAIDREDLKPYW